MTQDSPIDVAAMLTEVGVDAATASPATSVGDSALLRSEMSLASVPAYSSGAPDVTMDTLVGEGQTSAVYLGRQRSMRRKVAVRTVHKTRRTAAAPGYIVSEAWMLGALEHPNILPVYDIKRDDQGMPLVVMKAIEAEPWSKVIADPRHPLGCPPDFDPIEFNVPRMIAICSALEHAHHRGVIHRDVKPDNVLIGRDGTVYLHGWDLSVHKTEDDERRFPRAADQSQIAGTPAYMAPELATCNFGAVGEATDVYLAAATFHEVFTGAPRHLGENVFDAFYSATASQPVDYDTGVVPAELADILNKAMSAKPEDRFATVRALRHALEGFLRHRPSLRLTGHATMAHDEFGRALQADAEEFMVRELFATAFTAYSSAREFWPRNPDAIDGLTRLQREMLDYELRKGSAARAKDLMSRIGEDSSRIMARLAAAERREREENSQTIPRVRASDDATVSSIPTMVRDKRKQTTTAIMAVAGALFLLALLIALIAPAAGAFAFGVSNLVVVGLIAYAYFSNLESS